MIVIALGANKTWLGQSPEDTIKQATEAIISLGHGLKSAPLYNAPAWPDPSEPAYINTVITLETGVEAYAMLEALHVIEAGFGRHRGYLDGSEKRYAARTLDLDLIDHHGTIIAETSKTNLVLPHPSMHLRDFVLVPLADIAPEWRHPLSGKSALELIKALDTAVTCEKR